MLALSLQSVERRWHSGRVNQRPAKLSRDITDLTKLVDFLQPMYLS